MDELARSPGEAGLFFDFDGTLAEIVPRPEQARPLEGIRGVLEDLARLFRVVCVVSGRSTEQLIEWLGPRIEIWGLHGAERAIEGRAELAPEMAGFEDLMREVLIQARARIEELRMPGLVVEDKRIMVGLHWRMADDPAAAERAVGEIASELAAAHGLKLGRGKLALELRPPRDVSKKEVVTCRAREENLRAAAFAGDDVVDIPAFDALDELSERGVAVVKIAVKTEGTPAELIARADTTVDGPVGMLDWLQALRSLSDGVAGSEPD
jgi:trehalose 6-phosphate phosphatase